MWTSEHHYGIVAGAVASSYRIMQPLHSHPNHLISHPYERSPVFLLALLSPLPLRDLGILSCFLCIITMCAQSSVVFIRPNCLGHLPSSLLLFILVFSVDFSETHAVSLRLYVWKP